MWSIELRAQLAAAVELSWTTNWQPQAGSERRLNMCRHVEPVRKSPRYLPSCWGRPQASPQLWGVGPGSGLPPELGLATGRGPVPPRPDPRIGPGLGLGPGPSRQARA